MLRIDESSDQSVTTHLSRHGYWPAWAAASLGDGRYSETVQLCREQLAEEPSSLSGRIIYALALFKAGQAEAAREQFYHVLSADPDNVVALKYLGDIAFSEGDILTALAQYERVLEIDQYCSGLKADLRPAPTEKTHTVTLVRAQESVTSIERMPLRSIPFYTETMGDLYMSQGYHRLAAAVYRTLNERGRHPRLLEKLAHAEEKIKAKE